MQPDNESTLIAAAQKGSSLAFEQLYHSHVNRIYALCMRLSGDAHWAEDLCQDAFVQAWRKLGSFRGDSQFGTWMHRLSTNVVITQLRRSRRHLEEDLALFEHLPAITKDSAVDTDLEKAIAKLPIGARTVLVLHSIEGYTHEEISKLLDIAVGTSKSQLNRAKKSLTEWMT